MEQNNIKFNDQIVIEFQQKILQRKKPKISEIQKILIKFEEIQKKEKAVVSITEPVFIIGSLYGNFEDFQNILNLIGQPPYSSILFLGNYINFGPEQFYLYLYIITLKILYPKFIYLLRGGHESQTMNKIFGFYSEIIELFQNDQLWRCITQTYQYLSIAAILQKSNIICMSGGFPPQLINLKQIKNLKHKDENPNDKSQIIQRKNEINSDSFLSDLLWSIPFNDDHSKEFKFSVSGMGYTFPIKHTEKFLKENQLKKLIRTDQYLKSGIQRCQKGLIITIFSCLEVNKQKVDKAGFIYINEEGIIKEYFKQKIFQKQNLKIYKQIQQRYYM